MSEEISLEEYQEAYREIVREEEKRAFFTHLGVYIFVNAILISIDLILTSDNVLWFFYPLIGWGFGLAMHYLFGVQWRELELEEKEAKAEHRVRKKKK